MKPIFCILFTGWLGISSYAQPSLVEMSHYIFPDFKQGVVLMKDGKRNSALLNYNSLTEEMIFDNQGQKLAISKNQIPQIDTVLIQERKFVVLNSRFVELIHHATWELFVEYKCKLEEEGPSTGYGGTSQTSAVRSVSATAVDGRVLYNLSLPDKYKTKPYIFYWVKRDGELSKFINMKELKKMFNDKKDPIKKYSKSNRVRYNEPESIAQLIAFLELN